MLRPHLRKVSPLSLILVPLKQHLGCCVILPLLFKLLAATAFAEILHRLPHFELILALLLLPAVVYLALKLEDGWKMRAHRRKSACQLGCCPPAPDLGHFKRRFFLNLSIGAIMVFLLYTYADSDHQTPPISASSAAPNTLSK